MELIAPTIFYTHFIQFKVTGELLSSLKKSARHAIESIDFTVNNKSVTLITSYNYLSTPV